MARFTFPDEGSRLVFSVVGGVLHAVAGTDVAIYTDSAGTNLADLTDADGNAVANSVLTTDTNSLLPIFHGPSDGTDTLYAKASGSTTLSPVYARADDRLDTLATDVSAVTTTANGALQAANDLSDVSDAAMSRANLGLGDSATKNVGTSAGTVAAGDDSRVTGAVQKANNLSDLANAATARTNLGLGTAATHAATDFLSPGSPSTPATLVFIPPVTGSNGGGVFNNDAALAVPIYIPVSRTLTTIACRVDSAGGAGSTALLGIYADNGSFAPGNKLLDAGSVATDTTGTKSITISLAVTPGWYWAVLGHESVGTTAQFERISGNLVLPGYGLYQSSFLAFAGFIKTAIGGALPATFSSPVPNNTGPVVMLG